MRIIRLGFVVLACGFSACAQNEVTPYLPGAALVTEAGSGGAGDAGSGGRGTAGRAGSAAGRGGAGGSRSERTTCPERWQSDARPEVDLLDRFNQVRSNPRPICGFSLPPSWGAPPPIKTDDALQCVARLAFSGNPQRGITAPVTGRPSSGPDSSRDLQERVGDAGAPSNVYELLVIGADNADEVMMGIWNSQEASFLCAALTKALKVGIAHAGNVWVIDFAAPTQTSPAHSGPMPGDH